MRASILCALWAITGCVDPGAKLDAFHDRELAALAQDSGVPEAGTERDGAVQDVLPTPAQLEGSYLFVVSTVLSRKKPILSLVEVKAVRKGDGLELTQRDRPISAEDRQTLVGEFNPWRTSLVKADGSYNTGVISIVTPGAVNAVQPGVETESTLAFSGTLPLMAEGEPETPLSFWCGKADGMLLRPIQQSLDGSTFTVMRIVDPDAFPSPVINCAGEAAEPL